MTPLQTSKAVVDYYERYWREGLLDDNPYERWKMRRVRAHVSAAPAGARLLDVGCGAGNVLSEVAALGVRAVGIDVSDEAVSQARKRGLDALRADIDGGGLPLDSGAFEIVLCLDVFEHLFSPERLLADIARVLAPGGRLIVAVPNGLNLFNRAAFASGRHIDIMDKAHLSHFPFSEHVRFFSRDVFEAFLSGGGFVPRVRDYFFPGRFSDARFRAASWLARAVTAPRLHERWPGLFALEFLYYCELNARPRMR